MAELGNNINKNNVEIVKAINEYGAEIEYIKIDGQNIGMLGYTNEKDREDAIKVLNMAYESTGGNVAKMISALNTGAICHEKNISPDEQVAVDGFPVMLNYAILKAYTMDGEEIVSCDDLNTESGLLPDLPDSAVKAILVDRVKLWLAKKREEEEEDDDEDADVYIEMIESLGGDWW